ncbi:MAG: hypothetical protein WDN23_10610 [Edaphobacter sp.]
MYQSLDRSIVPGDEAGQRAVAKGSDVREGLGLAPQFDLRRIRNIQTAAIIADVCAEVPRGGRCLNGRIAAENHDGRSSEGLSRSDAVWFVLPASARGANAA